jgi:adenosylhomocysteine nucleosidase
MATSETSPIAVIAAEPREFSGLLRYATRVHALRWPVNYCCEAEIGGRRWILAANGPGPRLAQAAARCLWTEARPSAFVSTGFCGALDPSLSVGEIFVATEVRDGIQTLPAARPGLPSGLSPSSGPLISQDFIAVTPFDRRLLHSTGAAAVDMEAAAVAHCAIENQSAFFCIRVVSDSASEPLPMDFNRYRGPDGRYQRGRIAAAALARPSVLRGLLRLHRVTRRAAQSLGDFLARCRF